MDMFHSSSYFNQMLSKYDSLCYLVEFIFVGYGTNTSIPESEAATKTISSDLKINLVATSKSVVADLAYHQWNALLSTTINIWIPNGKRVKWYSCVSHKFIYIWYNKRRITFVRRQFVSTMYTFVFPNDAIWRIVSTHNAHVYKKMLMRDGHFHCHSALRQILLIIWIYSNFFIQKLYKPGQRSSIWSAMRFMHKEIRLTLYSEFA